MTILSFLKWIFSRLTSILIFVSSFILRFRFRGFPVMLLGVVFGVMLFSCETMDQIRYAYEGRDLNMVQIFGDEELDLSELEKIKLKGFSISDFHHPLVKKHIKKYQLYGKESLSAIISRSQYYLPMIKRIFVEKEIPLDLAYLPIIESGFNPKALSPAGASGLWQFMFQTGKVYKLNADYWVDDRRDVYRSTIAAAYHLKYLYKKFDDWLLALAAYNAGAGKISRAIKKYKTTNYWNLIKGKYLKPETKNYVAKFIASTILAQNPQKYGLTIKPIKTLKLKQVVVDDATDIKFLANSAKMNLEIFKKYNPQLKQWATPPSRAYPIYILEDRYENFMIELNEIPKDQRVTYRQYFVQIGDNLTTISKKFNVPINPIANINQFRSLNDIRAGSFIVIPIQGLSKAKKIDQIQNDQKQDNRTDLGKYTFLYLVQPQDSLYEVAKKFKVRIDDLIRWNRFQSAKSLRSGRLIIIKI